MFYKLTVPSAQDRARVLGRIRVGVSRGRYCPARIEIQDDATRERIGVASAWTILPEQWTTASADSYDQVLVRAAPGNSGTVTDFVGRNPCDCPESTPVLVGTADNEVRVNFDFWGWERDLQQEAFMKHRQPGFTRIPFPYHWIPASGRNLMMNTGWAIERGLRRLAGNPPLFPAWPIETSLDAIRYTIWSAAARLAGVKLQDAPYPGDRRFTCLLTHDIDSGEAMAAIGRIRTVERKHGMSSAWSFVSGKYRPDETIMRELIAEGCEIVSHGYRHDGRLPYSPPDKMRAGLNHVFTQLPWLKTHVRGYRSELLLRIDWLLSVLPEFFAYDLSYPDTEMYGPYGMASGCCTVYPFWRQGHDAASCPRSLLEIPLTLPQDFYLLFIHHLGIAGLLDVWKQKLDYIERLNGCAVLCLHPDHVLTHDELLPGYDEFLSCLADRPSWVTTPGRLYEFCREEHETAETGRLPWQSPPGGESPCF